MHCVSVLVFPGFARTDLMGCPDVRTERPVAVWVELFAAHAGEVAESYDAECGTVAALVERFDIEPYSDFSVK